MAHGGRHSVQRWHRRYSQQQGKVREYFHLLTALRGTPPIIPDTDSQTARRAFRHFRLYFPYTFSHALSLGLSIPLPALRRPTQTIDCKHVTILSGERENPRKQ